MRSSKSPRSSFPLHEAGDQGWPGRGVSKGVLKHEYTDDSPTEKNCKEPKTTAVNRWERGVHLGANLP